MWLWLDLSAHATCQPRRADVRRRQQEAIDYSRQLQRRLKDEKAAADREMNKLQAQIWAKRNEEVSSSSSSSSSEPLSRLEGLCRI